MFSRHKTKIFVVSCIVIVLTFGFVLKIKRDQKKEERQQVISLEQLKAEAEKNKVLFIDYSVKRSELQAKILKETQSMNSNLEKLISESQKIQFLQQEDFNSYEIKQNEIQNVIARKIIEGLKSKDKKRQEYFQKNIKQLELVERDLNQVRMKFSENIYEISKKENKKAVTFLSDTALIENLKLKK
jgi:hypothetical protein